MKGTPTSCSRALVVLSALVVPQSLRTRRHLWETTSQMSMEGPPISSPSIR